MILAVTNNKMYNCLKQTLDMDVQAFPNNHAIIIQQNKLKIIANTNCKQLKIIN